MVDGFSSLSDLAMAWLTFALVVCVATAQRWIPLSHERKTPNVDRNVLGNLKETKVLEKMLGLQLLAVEYLFEVL